MVGPVLLCMYTDCIWTPWIFRNDQILRTEKQKPQPGEEWGKGQRLGED